MHAKKSSLRFTTLSLVLAAFVCVLKTFGYGVIEKHFPGENALTPLLVLYAAIISGLLIGLLLAAAALARRERWPLLCIGAALLHIALWMFPRR